MLLQKKIMFNNNKDFDVDLAKGQFSEKSIAKILGISEDKLEIKTEFNYWKTSGNLCIELESYGKPSGITSTKAKYWCHCFNSNEELELFFVIPVKTLKKVVKYFLKTTPQNIRMLGDNHASKCILINIEEFHKSWREIVKNKNTTN